MTRLNLMLFFVLIVCSLGLVEAQHHTHKLYHALEQANQTQKKYELEYGQLQLEQSTQAMHSRIETIATREIKMQVPDEKRVQVVTLGQNAQTLPTQEVKKSLSVQSGAMQ